MLKLLEETDIAPPSLKETNLKRARYVVEQAEKQMAMLAYEEEDYRKICRALATLGEDGRELWMRVTKICPGYDEFQSNGDFNIELAMTKYKTPAKFFEIAGNAGLKTKIQVNLRKAKEDLTARDFLGEFSDEWLKYRLWESGGIYWGADKVRYENYEITNFTMKFLFFLKKDKSTSFRLITIKNIHGHRATIFVNTDEMVSVGSFKRVLEREGPFLFKGGDTDLSNIKDKLQHGEKSTTLVTQLGWNSFGFYAFANGIFDPGENKFIPVDEYGTLEFNTRDKHGHYNLRHYFIPANAKMYEEMDWAYTSDKKFTYKPLPVSFEDWSKQFALVFGKQGQMMMVFYMMAIFSDIIFKNMLRRFPIFSVYGMPFSGKGTMIESVMRLFGEGQDQVMLEGNSTETGIMRTFSQYSNAIVWLDEYFNSLRPKIIGSIKNIYDRKGYVRGKKDNTFETEISPVLSACILSGQDMPSINPALFSRVILTVKTGTKYTDQQRDNYRTLEQMENAGMSGITTYLMQYRGYFEDNFRTVFDAEYKKLAKAVNNNEVAGRMLSNYGAMIATAELLSTKITLPFTMVEFTDTCKNALMEHFYIMKGSDDLSKFWEIVQFLFNQGDIRENIHFKLANGYLYLRVDDIFQMYAEAMIKRKDPTGLEKETLKKYLESLPASFVAKTRVWMGAIQHRVMQFNYTELDIDLIRADTKEELQAIRKAMKVKTVMDDDDEEPELFDEP